MHTFSTPMMRQYQAIKAKYPECLLLYRMGDFYELFLEDAHIGSKILNITLTSKAGGKDGKIPMAGIPYHAVDSYLAKLVKAGYKVAICEQLSPPNKRGLVERDVIRVVTPGTMLDENALDKKENNYLISIARRDTAVSYAVADVSTGYFSVAEKEGSYESWLIDELARLQPSECILPDDLYNDGTFLKLLSTQQGMNIYSLQQWTSYASNAEKILKEHFGVATLAAYGIEEKMLSMQTAAALLGYLQETQKTTVKHIKKISVYEAESAMILDKSTMINLEVFSTIREHDTKGSLLSLLDETVTAMGARMLKTWIKKPLLDKEEIVARHDVVSIFVEKFREREKLRKLFEEIPDIERTLSRLAVGVGNPRDLITTKLALQKILEVKKFIEKNSLLQKNKIGKTLAKQISLDIKKVIEKIEKNIIAEPPIDTKNGGIIASNVNKQLDTLRRVVLDSKKWMEQLEQKERKATGIGSLKIRYNQVFGFYIEVSKANTHLVPSTYQRKQTLINGERFTTKDLKKHEEIILSAQEKANELEYQLFIKTLQDVLNFTHHMQQAAQAIAVMDCLVSFSYVSQLYHFTRPKILYSGEIRIQQGRHPVVEKLLGKETQFVPNDVCLDNLQSLMLITGPNMAGKSVFIRQVALIVLLCQIGCFVPAKSAHISLVDRIFVRSGAADVITSGLSTFMVEMVETAHILHNATSKSLILMDEIGRGTSTYDGISLAWAIAQYLVTHFTPSPKTLFATHYHELQQLEKNYPTIKNFHMAVAGDSNQPVFLHTLFSGGASHSFGVTVAKLAGVPEEVIRNASEMLHTLENRDQQENNLTKISLPSEEKDSNPLLFHMVQKELDSIDIATITPLQALNILAKIKDQLKLLQTTQKEFLETD